ncbi:MAG TPA: alpha/beta hydrolase [Candidatus Binataceae bacterium]
MSLQQLEGIVQMLRAGPQVDTPSVEQNRAVLEQMANFLPADPDITREPIKAGSVPAEWVSAPGADSSRSVLYLHGGGYVMGSINTHRALAGRISRAAQARVLIVDYRLAPEHPFPAAFDDSVAAYKWLLAKSFAPAKISIAGDSAGGGLTVATLVAIRDQKLPQPGAGVCLSPWIDLEGNGESMETKAAEDPVLQKPGLLAMAKHYLGGKDARTPLAAPLYADLAGLPPLLIQVGTAETLLDDSTRLAERAHQAGVRVTYEPYQKMIHVFQLFAPILDEGKQAIDKIGEFVRANTR